MYCTFGNTWNSVSLCVWHFQPTRLEIRLSQMSQKPNNTKDDYGLIISPTTEEKHNENLRMAYNDFLENSFKTNSIKKFNI